MGDMEEDRIYAETLGKTDVYVAAALGVTEVSVSNDRIGQFSLAHRCQARDVAADGSGLLVATDGDVLAMDLGGEDPTVERLGFGPAVAVGGADASLAAGPDGTIARRTDDEGWVELGAVEDPRAIDGSLIAAADGVYRVDDGTDAGDAFDSGEATDSEDALAHVGLDDARDVVAGPTPFAATGDGLYRLGPGWTCDLEGEFRVVTAEASRAHAATTDQLFVRENGTWRERTLPTDEPIVDVDYVADGGVVAVTGSGRFLVDPVAAKDGASGWRSRSLGLDETAAMAVPEQ